MNTQNDNPLEDLDTSDDVLDNDQDQADKTDNDNDGSDDGDDQGSDDKSAEDVASLQQQVKTLTKQKDHWRTKAQQNAGDDNDQSQQTTGIDQKDMYAMIKADVHEDDFDIVTDYVAFQRSRGNEITIADALKDRSVKNMLKESDEIRATEQAKNTSRKRSGNKGVSGQTLKDNLSKGEVPDAGSKEAEDLFWERRGGRRG